MPPPVRRAVTRQEVRNNPDWWEGRVSLLLVAVLLVGAVGATMEWQSRADADGLPKSAPGADGPGAAAGRSTTLSPKELVEEAAGALHAARVETHGDDLVVTFHIDERRSEGLTRAELAEDVYRFLERLRNSDVEFAQVTLRGSLLQTNKYGEVGAGPVVFTAEFDRTTVHRIVYGNIDRDELDHMRHLADRFVVRQPVRDDSWTWSNSDSPSASLRAEPDTPSPRGRAAPNTGY